MSDTFYERVIAPSEAARQFIADTGGLPEIITAAEGLLTAVSQTRTEIEEAHFDADRFSTEVSPELRNRLAVYGKGLNFFMRAAIETEGMAGAKRFELGTALGQVETKLFGAIQDLLELRTDLIVSQQSYSKTEEE